MSLFFLVMLISPMSHVDYKKRPCRPVDFRGLGPYAKQMFVSCPAGGQHCGSKLLFPVCVFPIVGKKKNTIMKKELFAKMEKKGEKKTTK